MSCINGVELDQHYTGEKYPPDLRAVGITAVGMGPPQMSYHRALAKVIGRALGIKYFLVCDQNGPE